MMGLRVRRRIKIAPGINLNLSKSGISTSVGGRGAMFNFGSGGKRVSVGLPGTGISYRRQVGGRRGGKTGRRYSFGTTVFSFLFVTGVLLYLFN